MASEQDTPTTDTPAPSTPSIADRYDIELDQLDQEDVRPAGATEETGAVSAPAAPSPSPARKPDGTFAKAETVKPTHSKTALHLAREHGIPQDEIDSLAPEVLEQVVYRLDRQYRDLMKQHSIQATHDSAKTTPAATTQTEAEGLGLSEPEDQFHPDIIRLFKAQAKEIKELKAAIGNFQGERQEEKRSRFFRECDKTFSKHEDLFGKGGGNEVKGDDLERRRAVLRQVEHVKGNTVAEKIEAAIKLLYPTREAKPGTSVEEVSWNAGALARPTQRIPGNEPPGVRKATRNVAAKLKDMEAASESNGSTTSNDEFL